MPASREIKRHIQSVRSIAKVTRAMEVVATAKYHRLQSRADSTRAFAERSWEVLNHLASAAEDQVRENPMFCGYPSTRHVGVVLISSNRGMVGSFNQQVIDLAKSTIASREVVPHLITIGRIGREAMLRERYSIHADFDLQSGPQDIAALTPVARVVLDGFRDRAFDEVLLASAEIGRGMQIQAKVRQLLPLLPSPVEMREYLYEPEPGELLMALLPRIIRFQIYQAHLDALIAENAARMASMRSASQNADDLMARLSLHYNKARQEAITGELQDILGGGAPYGIDAHSRRPA